MPHAEYAISITARVQQQTTSPILTETAPLLAAETLWWEEQLNGVGEHGCGLPAEVLDQGTRDLLRDPDTSPAELWVYRNQQLVAAGPIIGYALRGDLLELQARGLLYYLGYMVIGPDTGDQIFTNVDQFTIAKAVVDAWQALDYGDYGIDTSSVGTSGMNRDATFLAVKPTRVLEAVLRVGRRINGFDVTVDPTTRALELFHPEKGIVRPHVVIDGRNVASPGEEVSTAVNDIASEAYAIGEEDLVATASNTTLRSQFGRVGVWNTFEGVSQQPTLDDHAAQLQKDHDGALLVLGPDMVPLVGADEGDFETGDMITYSYDSGLGLRTLTRRVAVKRYELRGGSEKVRVGFI